MSRATAGVTFLGIILIVTGSSALFLLFIRAETGIQAKSSRPTSNPRAEHSIEPASVSILVGQQIPYARALFPVTLKNNGHHQVTIVGIPGVCDPVGCVEVGEIPAPISPGQSASFFVKFHAGRPGAINQSMVVYISTEAREGISVPITLSGSVVDFIDKDRSLQPGG